MNGGKTKKVVVVGSGLGGLSISSMLSESGFDVLLLEKREDVGGRARVSEINGFSVDYGIHASLASDRSAANDVLNSIGHKFKGKMAGIVFHDGDKFQGLIGKNSIISLGEGLKLTMFLLKALVKGVDSLYSMSVQEWLDQENASQGIQELIEGLCIALMASTSLERLSIGELAQFMRVAVRKRRAFGYPIGGWSSILDPMVEVINRKGEIRTNCEVNEVLIKNDTAIGVKTKDEEIKADSVICALPAQRLPSLVGREVLSDDYRQRLESLRETAGVTIDFGIDGHISSTRNLIITRNPPTLGWFISNLDPSLAPPGKQLLTTFSPIQVDRLKEKSDSRLKELEETYMNIFPKMTDKILWKRKLSTIINGAELNVAQTRKKRPSVETPIENLFLVGDTTNAPGVGGEIAFNSAKICFDLLQES